MKKFREFLENVPRVFGKCSERFLEKVPRDFWQVFQTKLTRRSTALFLYSLFFTQILRESITFALSKDEHLVTQ
ncbi:hypothetical protein HMPREF1869_00277 [Bacteroidales bacterium KA00251]|nr:hypothetical protein HMPREF1869_00277 [Bacteroidales bacterium KA00251]